jgi:hypothetical protein
MKCPIILVVFIYAFFDQTQREQISDIMEARDQLRTKWHSGLNLGPYVLDMCSSDQKHASSTLCQVLMNAVPFVKNLDHRETMKLLEAIMNVMPCIIVDDAFDTLIDTMLFNGAPECERNAMASEPTTLTAPPEDLSEEAMQEFWNPNPTSEYWEQQWIRGKKPFLVCFC